jgi:hypothetical protein
VAELALRRLLPLAREGLSRWGVDPGSAGRLLGIIEQRCLTGRTGADWQVAVTRGISEGSGAGRAEALRQMTSGTSSTCTPTSPCTPGLRRRSGGPPYRPPGTRRPPQATTGSGPRHGARAGRPRNCHYVRPGTAGRRARIGGRP